MTPLMTTVFIVLAIGGLIGSFFLTMLVLPSLSQWFADRQASPDL